MLLTCSENLRTVLHLQVTEAASLWDKLHLFKAEEYCLEILVLEKLVKYLHIN